MKLITTSAHDFWYITCNGSMIDSHWNTFGDQEEALDYLDKRVDEIPGNKYGLVHKTIISYEVG